MAKMTLDELKKHFQKYTLETQRYFFWNYIRYVAKFPETHDEGSYPVCFWEWYQNDFPNTEFIPFPQL